MVERSECINGEEETTDTNDREIVKNLSDKKSIRNDGFVLLGTGDAEEKRQTRGFQMILEHQVEGLESTRYNENRESISSCGSSTGRFSLFKWFKRGSRESTNDRRRRKKSNRVKIPDDGNFKIGGISDTSSNESIDTFYSTATVRSFDFHSGTLRDNSDEGQKIGQTSLDLLNHTQRKVGPFGIGASKLVVKKDSQRENISDVTKTLPANVLSKRRDITARYSLQPCGGFGSCGNFGHSQRNLSGSLRRLDDRGTSGARRVHVRGKRRAPNPPGTTGRKIGTDETSRGSGRKKRRPAPKPPERSLDLFNVEVSKDDTKVKKPYAGNVDVELGPLFGIEAKDKATSVFSVGKSTDLVATDDRLADRNIDKFTGKSPKSFKDTESIPNFVKSNVGVELSPKLGIEAKSKATSVFSAGKSTGLVATDDRFADRNIDNLTGRSPKSFTDTESIPNFVKSNVGVESSPKLGIEAKAKATSVFSAGKSTDLVATDDRLADRNIDKFTGRSPKSFKDTETIPDFVKSNVGVESSPKLGIAAKAKATSVFSAGKSTGLVATDDRFADRNVDKATGRSPKSFKDTESIPNFVKSNVGVESSPKLGIEAEAKATSVFSAGKSTDLVATDDRLADRNIDKFTGRSPKSFKDTESIPNFVKSNVGVESSPKLGIEAKAKATSVFSAGKSTDLVAADDRLADRNIDKFTGRSPKSFKDTESIPNFVKSNVGVESSPKLGIEAKAKATSVFSAGKSTDLVAADDRLADRNIDKITRSPKSFKDNEVTYDLVSAKVADVANETSSLDLSQSICNDTLILQGGVLLSKKDTLTKKSIVISEETEKLSKLEKPIGQSASKTGSQASVMPRPWYKRSVFEHSRDTGTSKRGDILRNPSTTETKEDSIAASTSNMTPKILPEKNHEGGTLSRLNFFHRNDKNTDERKKDKRKSGLSILTNISELDKEAAAIVQEEQARTRAASLLIKASRIDDEQSISGHINKEVVQDIVTSSIESSPRRGTRALISKFNAIGNITKVTVNSNFFTKNTKDDNNDKISDRNSKYSPNNNWRDKMKFQGANVKVDKDLSRYFLPQQNTTKNRFNDVDTDKNSTKYSPKNSRASADISARLSFLQGRTNNQSILQETRHEVNESREKEKKTTETNSPKFSRLQSINSEISKIDDDVKKNVEVIQKEFSSIFNEIDRQLASKEFQTVDKLEKKNEAGPSSKVTKVLDILVEAEKSDRLKYHWLKSNNEEPKKIDNFGKYKNSQLKEDPIKMDLKEMLKEMKHSLPKRPKPKKSSANQDIEKKSEDTKLDENFFYDDQNKRTHLMNSVTVAYPPPIRIGPPINSSMNPINIVVNDEREYERQKKVSSAAQTSGNVRKVTRQNTSSETSNWKKDDVVYRTSGKNNPSTSGLVKNTFQLIRPREFAQIEAIKTMKSGKHENTYANVIERQSLYANALVTADKKNSPLSVGMEKKETTYDKEKKNFGEERKKFELNKISGAATTSNDESQDARIAVDHQNMNTLAVNRLLRKLEAAIASGYHQQAAGLAKELARLKIHCSVVRQRTKAKDVINVDMYIEDKLAHQGPIPLRLTRSMSVAQLKAKVFTEFEIPTNVQRWIVGKNLADDDETTLEQLRAVEGSPVFLYLVAPDLKVEEQSGQPEVAVAKEVPQHTEPETVEEITTVAAIEEEEEDDDDEEEVQAELQMVKEEDDECISEELKMERYEALISLENCDVIPNSEPIECPICFVTYGPQEGVILRDCLHMFCRPCIANTIRYCEEPEVKCPFRDTEYTCESTLQEREIKALVEPEVYQQHLAKSIAQAENNAGNNSFHCKTPDCPGWCIYDDNVNNFLCPVCKANNCLTCQVVHTGKNCRQYQQELRFSKETDQESKRTAAMLEEMVDRGEALSCPKCAVVLMKKWGCDWLRCSMCKTEICWVTRGPRWGPGGKGDTSGGCRCGENGVKCHPRCSYCH